MPPRWENVGEQHKVGYFVGTRRESEGVEVCVGDAEALGLAACVGPHRDIAVHTTGETAGKY